MAMGMMFVMLLGNVDLSVGTSVSLIGISGLLHGKHAS